MNWPPPWAVDEPPPANPWDDPPEAAQSTPPADSRARRMVPGGSFVLDVPDLLPSVWGRGNEVLWAEGESLILVGGNGVGKTTLAGQLVRARIGLVEAVLGLPVTPGRRRVLYLAMDRPAQIRRSLRRTFQPEDRKALDERLIVWPGPPPADLARDTNLLADLCRTAHADTVFVDSLKDAALGLSEDEVGAGWNRARQAALVADVQVLELHHNVKRNATGGPPDSIADVYGSAWITAGAGSVLALHGAPGDPIVLARHLKQPAEEVGPWRIRHDHDAGVSEVWHGADLLHLVESSRSGLTAKDAARALFETDKPTQAETEKARRRLEALTRSGHLQRRDGASGGADGGTAATWFAAARLHVDGAA